MVIGRVLDAVVETVESSLSGVQETFFEPVIRLGVTGLSRTGKTVFITSLVSNLLNPGRMTGFSPQITAAYLQPQPDDTVARFDYEAHLAQLTGADPSWPEGTRTISELRLSLKVQVRGFLPGLGGERTVHIDIVDYPGEWLLDLSLLEMSYEIWAARSLSRLEKWGEAEVLAALRQTDPNLRHDEVIAQDVARTFTQALRRANANGAYDCSPGRFLLPGDLEGSPALTFAPLPAGQYGRGSLGREMARRFEAYKTRIVRPFFRTHFAKIDRQVVLIDALGAYQRGPAAFTELRHGMSDLLKAFRLGQNGPLAAMLGGKRVERLLFAATMADHVHHTQHAALTSLAEALVDDAARRAGFSGVPTKALSIASLRATTESSRQHEGRDLGVVQGRQAGAEREMAYFSGTLPETPSTLFDENALWAPQPEETARFLPAAATLKPGFGPPHIRLDQAAEFLFADRLT